MRSILRTKYRPGGLVGQVEIMKRNIKEFLKRQIKVDKRIVYITLVDGLYIRNFLSAEIVVRALDFWNLFG